MVHYFVHLRCQIDRWSNVSDRRQPACQGYTFAIMAYITLSIFAKGPIWTHLRYAGEREARPQRISNTYIAHNKPNLYLNVIFFRKFAALLLS